MVGISIAGNKQRNIQELTRPFTTSPLKELGHSLALTPSPYHLCPNKNNNHLPRLSTSTFVCSRMSFSISATNTPPLIRSFTQQLYPHTTEHSIHHHARKEALPIRGSDPLQLCSSPYRGPVPTLSRRLLWYSAYPVHIYPISVSVANLCIPPPPLLQHRMPEHHNCQNLASCRQQAFDKNKAKLESERTVASKMGMA